jgi:hypothetical protein
MQPDAVALGANSRLFSAGIALARTRHLATIV